MGKKVTVIYPSTGVIKAVSLVRVCTWRTLFSRTRSASPKKKEVENASCDCQAAVLGSGNRHNSSFSVKTHLPIQNEVICSYHKRRHKPGGATLVWCGFLRNFIKSFYGAAQCDSKTTLVAPLEVLITVRSLSGTLLGGAVTDFEQGFQ